VTLPHSAVI